MQVNVLQLQFEKKVSEAGLRMTTTRRGIFDILSKAERPLEITEIVTRLPGVHFVSVYRSVDALRRAGLIKQLPYGFKNRFELSDAFLPHHHHATCDVCGTVYEINNGKIEQALRSVTNEVGFTSSRHHFEIYGTCRTCSKSAQ